MRPIPTREFPDGTAVPALGMGTWRMGERPSAATREIAALREGLDLGMTLIDTAEMYADGGSERIVGEAIAGRRDEVFIVTKVYPHNAGAKSAITACERSLARLATDRIDLYLLHWRGRIPLAETVGAFERLRQDGKIIRWGVSNLAAADMDALWKLPDGLACASDQVLYHLDARGIEWDLLPWLRERRVPAMAYCPLAEGRLTQDRRLAAIAAQVGLAPAQLALAWLLRQAGVITIPASSRLDHIRANRAAAEVELDPATLAALDEAFPPPAGPTPLGIV